MQHDPDSDPNYAGHDCFPDSIRHQEVDKLTCENATPSSDYRIMRWDGNIASWMFASSGGDYLRKDGNWEILVWWDDAFVCDAQHGCPSPDEARETDFPIEINSFSLQHFEGAYRLVEHVGLGERITTSLSESESLRLWSEYSTGIPSLMREAVEKLILLNEKEDKNHPAVKAAMASLNASQKVIFAAMLESTGTVSYCEYLYDLEVWSPKDKAGPSSNTVFNRLMTIREQVDLHGFYFVPRRKGNFSWIKRPDRFID